MAVNAQAKEVGTTDAIIAMITDLIHCCIVGMEASA